MMFSAGGMDQGQGGLLAFGDSQVCARREVFISKESKESFVRTHRSSSSLSSCHPTCAHLLPNCFKSACIPAGWQLPTARGPLLSWLRILHSRDSCTLRAQWNPPRGLPAPPIFHELGPDTSMRGKTMSETLPALAPGLVRVTQLPPAARPSTRHFTKQTDPWRLSVLLGVTAARMFSQPLAPTGSRLRRESFLLLLFCFYFLWMALGEKCRWKHNTAAIHKKGKETRGCLEIFGDKSKRQVARLPGGISWPRTGCCYPETSCPSGLPSLQTWLITIYFIRRTKEYPSCMLIFTVVSSVLSCTLKKNEEYFAHAFPT